MPTRKVCTEVTSPTAAVTAAVTATVKRPILAGSALLVANAADRRTCGQVQRMNLFLRDQSGGERVGVIRGNSGRSWKCQDI
jgi:microcompartment protein CcmK/EutM